MGKPADVDSPRVSVSTLSTKRAFTVETFSVEEPTIQLETFWAETRKEICHDLKSTRWCRSAVTYFKWLLLFLWLGLLMTGCIMIPFMTDIGIVGGSFSWTHCAPNNSFIWKSTNPWNLNWTFEVVLAFFNSLTYTKAKMIDLAWDIIIGRLGQTLLVYCSWKAFSLHVRLSMERAPITYRTFWTIFMQREVTFRSIARMFRDFTSRRSLHSKTAAVFMLATMVFLMAFPTIVGAMTGYSVNNEAVVKLEDGTQALFEDFLPFYYIIHDGDRVSLNKDYKVFQEADACNNQFCVGDYITKFGVNNDSSSIWFARDKSSKIALQSPTLNITTYDGKENNKSFIYSRNIYTLPYVKEHAVCQPVMVDLQQTYQWGFSAVLLEATMIIVIIWTFGVWIMWFCAHLELSRRAKDEVPYDLKATLFLADAIRSDFKNLGENTESLVNEQLTKLTSENLKGGRVEIPAPLEDDYSLRRSLWHWLKDNRYWTPGFLFSFSFFPVWGNAPLFVIMGFAMAAGWGKKTRAVMAWAAFIVGWAAFLPWLLKSLEVIH